MATATSRLRLIKQAYNENINSHGLQVNTGAFDMTDEAFGVKDIAVAANVTLSVQDYLTDESRHLVLVFTGAGGFTVTHPAVDKPYLVINDCVAAVTLQPDGGTGASIGAGQKYWYYTNDAGTVGYFISRRLDELEAPTAALDLNSQKIENLADATAANDAVNKGQLDSTAFSAAMPAASTDKDMVIWDDGASQYQARQLVVADISDYAFASQAEAEAGTATDKPLNALRTKQAIDALSPAIPAGSVLLSTSTVSGSPAAVDLTITGSYVEYEFVIDGIAPATNGTDLLMQYSTDGGSTFLTTGYRWHERGVFDSSTESDHYSTTTPQLADYVSNNASYGAIWGRVKLFDPSNNVNTQYTRHSFELRGAGSGYGYECTSYGGGWNSTTTAVDAIRFKWASGNFANKGVIRLYGVSR